MSKNLLSYTIPILLMFAFIAVLFLSCGHEDLLAPAGASLILSANPVSIPADGESTSEIQAIVQDSTGQALNGLTIFFSTTLGSITEKAEVENGIAKATLTAGNDEGTATVRAFSGNLFDSLQVTIGFQNVNIFLTANPTEIPASLDTSSRIDAYITEEKGVVPNGTDVFFTTTLGSVTPNAFTTNGLASTILTPGLVEGTATVTAIVRNSSDSINVTIGIPVSTMTLDANPSTFSDTTDVADTYVSNVRATTWDASGNPIENKPVIITSDLGQLDSGGAVQKTDSNGQVTDTFRITIDVPSGTSQSVRITATSGSISTTTTITINH